ncbi:insulinoma-associated protein 1-like [Orussus abietinus]|uniref:insulinoma-associated protein 1-like n=1 Tax=Orussus abietinus TaxID=222816 RepID=UPI000625B4D9|nr:insulinoma-associated protein 1-like [Orussus abietinus]
MLHGTLPRAFLAPGLAYRGGYYGEGVLAYPGPAYLPLEEHYPRLGDSPAFAGWQATPRSATPCPLDLSLKPPPTPSSPTTEDGIEVDDEDDRRSREEQQGRCPEDIPSAEEMGGPRRSSSVQSYERFFLDGDPTRDPGEEKPLGTPVGSPGPFYSGETLDPSKYPGDCKMPPTGHFRGVPSYHQQLLLTPQPHAPMTPPSTPSPPQCPRRRPRDDEEVTPRGRVDKPNPRPKKKYSRRLKFDEDTSSPVSGTVILGPDEAVVTGDIDPAFNVVEVTEEARAELAKIENRLGPYQCKLCRLLHEDAFQLAQHRCSRIAHVEYRCPECDKRFSCPANLASHRRWHKPRISNGENGAGSTSGSGTEIPCTRCDAKFTRQAALRKHLANQHPETGDDDPEESNSSQSKILVNVNSSSLAPGEVPTEIP